MINDEADEVMKQLFDSLNNRYHINMGQMKGSVFVFNCVHLLYYKCQKINPNCERSYINSPNWIKNKRKRINPIHKKDRKCFEYAFKFALNHEEIRKNSQRITKTKSSINEYNWEAINILSEKNDWKKIEKNNCNCS